MEKMLVIEWETDGARWWGQPFPESQLDEVIEGGKNLGLAVSDIDECAPEYLALHPVVLM